MNMENTYEFDLVVRVKGYKPQPMGFNYGQGEKEPELVILEELKFNTLDAGSVIRKLTNYIR